MVSNRQEFTHFYDVAGAVAGKVAGTSIAATATSYIHHRVDLTALFNVPQDHFFICLDRKFAGVLKITG